MAEHYIASIIDLEEKALIKRPEIDKHEKALKPIGGCGQVGRFSRKKGKRFVISGRMKEALQKSVTTHCWMLF